jgi:hypothetical protein
MSLISLGQVWKVIDQSLDTLAGERGRPSYSNGLLSLLTSRAWQNAGLVKLGNLRALNQGNGKAYTVARTFNPKSKSTPNLGENQLSYCPTEGSKVKPVYDEVKLRYYHVSNVIEIDDEILRCIQQGRTDYQNFSVTNELISYLDTLDKLIAGIIANDRVGTFKRCDCDAAADECRNLPLFMANGFQINPTAQSILTRDAMESQTGMSFVLLGGQILKSYQTAMQIQVGNDLGFNAGLQPILSSIFFDANIGPALGDSKKILAMPQGAIQLVTASNHQGEFAYEDPTHMRATVVDPFYGLTHDVSMYTETCGQEIKRFLQFGIWFDVLGVPDCWTTDCQFEGMKDVFCYTVTCADDSFCDIEDPCGESLTKLPKDRSCDLPEECAVACRANFGIECGTFSVHNADVTETEVNAFRVNGLNFNLSQTYDLTDATDSAAFLAELKTKLGAVSGVYLVSGSFAAATTTLNIVTAGNITQIDLVVANAADVQLDVDSLELLHVYDFSTPSNSATITDLAWSLVGSGAAFNGAKGVAITGEAGITGDYDNYFADNTHVGNFTLTITDSKACTSAKTIASGDCGGVA